LSKLIAENLLHQGARVLLTDGKLHTVENFRSHFDSIYCLPFSLTEQGSVDTLIHDADEILNVCNTIINVIPLYKAESFFAISPQDWDDAMSESLKSSFLLCKNAVHDMLASREGYIIHIYPKQPGNFLTESISTALHAFSRSIAKEYGRKNIRSNDIVIDAARLTEKDYLLEITKTVAFLLSGNASFVSGEIITV